MQHRCALCDEELNAIPIVRIAGDADHPEPLPLCQRCGFVSPDERKRLRDQAMTRMLTNRNDERS